MVMPQCRQIDPRLMPVSESHQAACLLVESKAA
jgi:hypothetical protein